MMTTGQYYYCSLLLLLCISLLVMHQLIYLCFEHIQPTIEHNFQRTSFPVTQLYDHRMEVSVNLHLNRNFPVQYPCISECYSCNDMDDNYPSNPPPLPPLNERGKESYLSSSTSKTSKACYATGWDIAANESIHLTSGCSLVVYTVCMYDEATSLPTVIVPSGRSIHGTYCTVAFIHKKGTLSQLLRERSFNSSSSSSSSSAQKQQQRQQDIQSNWNVVQVDLHHYLTAAATNGNGGLHNESTATANGELIYTYYHYHSMYLSLSCDQPLSILAIMHHHTYYHFVYLITIYHTTYITIIPTTIMSVYLHYIPRNPQKHSTRDD
jgi:hypothetical protein